MGKMKKDKINHKFDPIGIHRTRDSNNTLTPNEIDAANILSKALDKEFENNGPDRELFSFSSKTINEETKSRTVSTIMEQLKKRNDDQLECTCCTVANYASNAAVSASLIEAGAGAELVDCVRHADVRISLAAIGALRNLIISGGSTACDIILSTDLIKQLLAILNQYATTNEVDANSINRLIQAVKLVSILCEYSDKAVDICTGEQLEVALWTWITSKPLGVPFSLCSAQCLYVLTQDNLLVQQRLTGRPQDNVANELTAMAGVKVTNGDDLLMKALCLGIAANISNTARSHEIMVRFGEILDEDVMPTVAMIGQLLPDQKGNQYEENKDIKDRLETTSAILSAQCLAIEVITNITCSSDSMANETDEAWQVDSGDDEDEDCNSAMDLDSSNSNQVSEVLLKTIQNCELVKKLLQKSASIEDSIVKILEQNETGLNVIEGVNSLRNTSLLCLSNVVALLPQDLFPSEIDLCWKTAGSILTDGEKKEDMELMTSSTAVLRSAVEKIPTSTLSAFSDNDLQFMLKLTTFKDDDLIVNCLRIISVIGQYYSTQSQTHLHPMLMSIAVSLTVSATRQSRSLRVVAESLDAVFDVFSDDATNGVLDQFPLLDKLHSFSGNLRVRIKNERSEISQHLPIIQTAQSNLKRFIAYKKSVMK